MTAKWKGPFRKVSKLSYVNYQVNVGAHRGLVTYYINLLKRNTSNRNIVMNISLNMSRCMTIPVVTDTYRDVTIGTNKCQRQSVCALCEDLYDKRDYFTFPSQLSLYQWQYSSINSVWSLHFTTNTLF
jgi:hypothetical protein